MRPNVRHYASLACLAAAMLHLGCNERPAAPQPKPPVSSVAAKQVALPAPDTSKAGVFALVERWVAAQNSGDFAAYDALYATRFEGVKRIGSRTRRYDRAAWMKDRQRMFGKPMHVEAADVTVTLIGRLMSVVFEQRWSSGTFGDVGQKQLILERDGDALRISREEMLTSKVTTAGAAIEIAFADFMQVEKTARQYVVLSARADEAWGSDVPVFDGIEKDSLYAAIKLARVDALPADLRIKDLPKDIELYGASGKLCSATTGKLFLLRRFIAPDGLYDADRPRPGRRKVAEDVWSGGSGRTLLVAEVDGQNADCSEALWARAAQRPAPSVFVSQDADAELVTRVKARVRELAGYKKDATAYRRYIAEQDPEESALPRRWEDFGGSEPHIKIWRNGDRSMLSYDTVVGGCGDFAGALWALFELRGDVLELLVDSSQSSFGDDFAIEGVVDFDLDGRVEVIGGTATHYDDGGDVVGKAGPAGIVSIKMIGTSFHGCGC